MFYIEWYNEAVRVIQEYSYHMEVDSIEDWEDFRGREELPVLPIFVCSPGISAAAMQYESSSDSKSEQVLPEAPNPLQTHNRKHYSSMASSLGPEHYNKPSDQYKPKWRRNKHCELQSCFCQKTYFFKIPRSDNFRIVARRNDYVHAMGCFMNCFPKVLDNEKVCFTIPDEEISEVYNQTTIEELRNFCDEAADYCKEHTKLTNYSCFKYLNRILILLLYGGIALTVIAVLTFLNDMTQIILLLATGSGSVLLFVLIFIFHKCINTRTKRLEVTLKKYIDSKRNNLEEKKVRPIVGMYGYWIEFRIMQTVGSPGTKIKVNVDIPIRRNNQEEKVDVIPIPNIEPSESEKNSVDIEEEKKENSQIHISDTVKQLTLSLENLRNHDSRPKKIQSNSSSSEEEDSDKENIPPTQPEEIKLKVSDKLPPLSPKSGFKSHISNISSSPRLQLRLGSLASNSGSNTDQSKKI